MNEPNVFIEMNGLDFRQDVEPLIKEFFPLLYRAEGAVSLNFSLSEEKMSVGITECRSVEQENATAKEAKVQPLWTEVKLNMNKADTAGTEANPSINEADTTGTEAKPSVTEADTGRTATKLSVTEAFESSETAPKKRHRDYRNQLLRAVYRLLRRYTGKELPWGILTGVRPTKLVYERIERGLAGNLQFMADTYYVSKEKAALSTRIAAVEYQLLDALDYRNGYSLYIGIPFCPSICNYCSFGSHPIGLFENFIEPYLEALKKEIAAVAGCFPERKLQTVYFGGGTPTSVSAGQLRSLIQCVKDNYDLSAVKEFTVEAGRPDSITEEKLRMLKEEGITRISVNPQTMVQRTLDTIGRKHTVEETVGAFRLARDMGFDNINMDLIAGLTGENIDDFTHTLSEIEKLEPDSITVHTLARKRAARLTTDSAVYEGNEAQDVAEMVDKAASFMKAHDYEPYYLYRQKNMTDNLENVGYARRGKEGLYNILIMEEKQIILACGSGASSKFVRDAGDKRFERVENVKNVSDYISRIDEMIGRKLTYISEHDIR